MRIENNTTPRVLEAVASDRCWLGHPLTFGKVTLDLGDIRVDANVDADGALWPTRADVPKGLRLQLDALVHKAGAQQ